MYTLPGMTVEVRSLQVGCSRQLFDGIFAAGGITLSQVSVMTGLEPYLIQNWVKRGFVPSPVKRQYGRTHFARIVIIRMLRDAMQIDRICALLDDMSGSLSGETMGVIGDDELYHRYVDLLSGIHLFGTSAELIESAVEHAVAEYDTAPHRQKHVCYMLKAMIYTHIACTARRKAEELLATLQ